MNTKGIGRIGALLLGLTMITGGFFGLVRPWYLRWGATDEEIRRSLPGDEIVANVGTQETRAITIRASVDRVWPWLAQVGQDRGGFYSYDLLENLVGCEMPTVDRLVPEHQAWQVGDKLWMYPPTKAGGVGFATLRTYLPGRALGFGTRVFGTPLTAPEDGSWSFILERMDDSTSRLLVRGRGSRGRSLLGRAFDASIFEPVHFAMERRMMIGVRQLATGSDRGRLANHFEVATWFLVFGLFVSAVVLTLVRRDWGRPAVGVVAAGLLFQVVTLGQPPAAIGIGLAVVLIGFIWRPRSRITPNQPDHRSMESRAPRPLEASGPA